MLKEVLHSNRCATSEVTACLGRGSWCRFVCSRYLQTYSSTLLSMQLAQDLPPLMR